jgi:dynein heavy chain
MLQQLDETEYATISLLFSGQTSSQWTQEIIESKLIRRTKNKMVPDGKKGLYFFNK